ncbi:argininosuccinate lyase [bacterium]|nr:argininosuccinate lyase [bacterium]
MTDRQPTGPVWAKRVSAGGIDAVNVAYCAGRDVRGRPAADHDLIEHDLATNAAHALMLADRGILCSKEERAILAALLDVKARYERGETIIDPAAEDVHMSIESFVTAKAGPGAGGRLHTGRSRNDQVATDMRLWLRGRIAALSDELADLAGSLAAHARAHAESVCPGMTHMQPAMVTTWGHWTAGYLARLVRDLRHLGTVLAELRECPLGSAASFGTSWPIDRERTAALLGFGGPTLNSTDSIWARGELEARYVFAAAQVLGHLSGMGQDLILLSSPPRQWIRLDDAFVTGSSIMPQKRNPDFAEVTRARAAVLAGHLQALIGVGTAVPAGYNRDSQWTKYTVMDAAAEAEGAPTLFARVFETLAVDVEAMRAACAQGFLNATDVADFLSRTRELPFRDCYRLLGRAVASCEEAGHLDRDSLNAALAEQQPDTKPMTEAEWAQFDDPVELLSLRSQTGSPNPEKVAEAIENLEAQARSAHDEIAVASAKWRKSIAVLWEEVARRAS